MDVIGPHRIGRIHRCAGGCRRCADRGGDSRRAQYPGRAARIAAWSWATILAVGGLALASSVWISPRRRPQRGGRCDVRVDGSCQRGQRGGHHRRGGEVASTCCRHEALALRRHLAADAEAELGLLVLPHDQCAISSMGTKRAWPSPNSISTIVSSITVVWVTPSSTPVDRKTTSTRPLPRVSSKRSKYCANTRSNRLSNTP